MSIIGSGLSRQDLADICEIFSKALGDVAKLLNVRNVLNGPAMEEFTKETTSTPSAGRLAYDPIPEWQRTRLLELIKTRGYEGIEDPLTIRCQWCRDCRNAVGVRLAVDNCECQACGRWVIADRNGKEAAQSIPEKINPPNVPDWYALAYFVSPRPEVEHSGISIRVGGKRNAVVAIPEVE